MHNWRRLPWLVPSSRRYEMCRLVSSLSPVCLPAPRRHRNAERLGKMVSIMERISPQQAKDYLKAGALLVCAYDSEAKFRQNRLEGAIPLDEFRACEGSTPRDRE